MKISLEYAHASLGAIDKSDIQRSVEAARAVDARLVDDGHEVTRVVLLDDKTVDPANARERAEQVLGLAADLGLPGDLSFSETDLRSFLPNLEQILPSRARKRLNRDASTGLTKYGNLPCSVDIALWHSLRLGLLGVSEVGSYDLAISVLGDGNREFEDLASDHFLRFLEPTGTISRIITLFYPQSPVAPPNTDELLNTLNIAMKEATQWPSS